MYLSNLKSYLNSSEIKKILRDEALDNRYQDYISFTGFKEIVETSKEFLLDSTPFYVKDTDVLLDYIGESDTVDEIANTLLKNCKVSPYKKFSVSYKFKFLASYFSDDEGDTGVETDNKEDVIDDPTVLLVEDIGNSVLKVIKWSDFGGGGNWHPDLNVAYVSLNKHFCDRKDLEPTYQFLSDVEDHIFYDKYDPENKSEGSALFVDVCSILSPFLYLLHQKSTKVGYTYPSTPRQIVSSNKITPSIEYKILILEPPKDRMSSEKRKNFLTSITKKKFHSVRGHTRQYTPEKPLFGKFVGEVAIKEHNRGDKSVGEIHKDYVVQKGKESNDTHEESVKVTKAPVASSMIEKVFGFISKFFKKSK